MQVTMTADYRRSRVEVNIKSITATILVFLIAFISIILIISMKKKNLIFEQQYFYFVCADSSKKVSVLDGQKEYLKTIGGASVTHYHLNNFYLVANVYLDTNDANEIKNNIISRFSNAMVVTIKTAKLSKKTKKELKLNAEMLKFIKFLYRFKKEFQESSMKYFSGEMAESSFVTSMVSKNLRFNGFKDCEYGDSDISNVVKDYAGLFALQFSSFLNNFYIAKSKQHYVSAYYVGFVINYLEFYNSL